MVTAETDTFTNVQKQVYQDIEWISLSILRRNHLWLEGIWSNFSSINDRAIYLGKFHFSKVLSKQLILS